jgi:hypothetical protein
MNALGADKRFFSALIAGDARALDRILAEDFLQTLQTQPAGRRDGSLTFTKV